MTSLVVSALPKVWIIDLDGVVLRHNGYRDGGDELLPGTEAFWAQIGVHDVVVLVSARTSSQRAESLALLARHRLRVDYDLFGMPVGERVLINDMKPSGLVTALALNLTRDVGLGDIQVVIDESW